jgi:hypothetical protein
MKPIPNMNECMVDGGWASFKLPLPILKIKNKISTSAKRLDNLEKHTFLIH